MSTAAISVLVVLWLALDVAVVALLWFRPQPPAIPDKVDEAQTADERRLAATTDPARRAKLQRRMADRMKGQ